MDPVTISAALGGIGQLLNSFGIGNNAAEWNRNALVSLWNRAQQGDEMARQMFAAFADPSRDAALDVEGALRRPVIDQAPYILENNQNLTSGVPDILRQFLGEAYTPEMGRLNTQSEGAAGRAGGVGDIAAQLFAGGGWSPQSQQLFDFLAPMMEGRGSNTQLALGNVAPSLISQRGQTAYTQAMQDRATDAANSRGLSPDLQFAIDRAKDTLATGGNTSTSDRMSTEGMDAFGAALQKALGGSLLSPGEAANWSREEATNNILGQTEAVYRQARQRGGGPGTLVASGTGQQMLADFADQAARLQSEQARKGFGEAEGRALQDKAIAAGLAGTGAGLAQSGEQNAIARTGQAYSAIPGTSSAANQFLSTMLGAGGDAGNQEVARMGAGTSMANAFLGSQGQAAGQFGTTLANQNQYALGGGQLANTSSNTESNILNQIIQSMLGAGSLGNQQAGTVINGQSNNQANTNNFWANLASARQNAVNPLTSLAGQALGYAGQNVGLMGAPFGNLQGGTAQGGINFGQLGAGLGGLIGMIPSGGANNGVGNRPGDAGA